MTKQQAFLYNELPALIDKVQENSQPRWGKMTAQHMLEHLSGVNYLALGKITAKLEIPEEQVPRAQAWLASDKMFRKNIRLDALPEEPSPLRFADIEEAKSKAKGTLQRFKSHFDQQPEFKAMHPAFGMLTRDQWEQFLYKHYRHHLAQFGIIELET
ncbi:MAG: DUF1569 domain-containing protein [Bacteroidia bacterium]